MESIQSVSIYLASQSPRRREILQQIGVPHEVVLAQVIEAPLQDESPQQYVQRLACEKAQAGLAAIHQHNLPIKPVLGADTIVVSGGSIVEKPKNYDDFVRIMQLLSGKSHQVITAVALVSDEALSTRLSITEVDFRDLTPSEIEHYWATGEPCDKAGGYGIQGLGSVFVTHIRGSYSGVVGLPIAQTVELLKEFGVSWWQI